MIYIIFRRCRQATVHKNKLFCGFYKTNDEIMQQMVNNIPISALKEMKKKPYICENIRSPATFIYYNISVVKEKKQRRSAIDIKRKQGNHNKAQKAELDYIKEKITTDKNGTSEFIKKSDYNDDFLKYENQFDSMNQVISIKDQLILM